VAPVPAPLRAIDQAVWQTGMRALDVAALAGEMASPDSFTRHRAYSLTVDLLRVVPQDKPLLQPSDVLVRWSILVPWASYRLGDAPDPAALIHAVLPSERVAAHVVPGMFDGLRAELAELEARLADWWPDALADYRDLVDLGWSLTSAMQAVCAAFAVPPPPARTLAHDARAAADEAMRTGSRLSALAARFVIGGVDRAAVGGQLDACRGRDERRLATLLPRLWSLDERRLLAAWAVVVPWTRLPEPAPTDQSVRRDRGPAHSGPVGSKGLADRRVAEAIRRDLEMALRRRQPRAMRVYARLVREGLSPTEAMRTAAAQFAPQRVALLGRRSPVGVAARPRQGLPPRRRRAA
jgi:hypothetical protein